MGKDATYKVLDYYPFGMQMPSRSFTGTSGYKFGYNTQLRSDELHQNHYTAQFWEYDSRAVKRWNIDPEYQKYSSQSPYVVNHNNPIVNTDPYGDDPWSAVIGMAIDYGIQVTANVITREKGDTWGDILYKKVDFVDVAVSGVQGLVLGPVAVTNSLRKKVAVVVGGELVKAMYSDAGIERKEDGTINTKKIATDFTISLVTGYAADVSGDKLIKVSKTAINQAENLLVKAEKKYAEKVVNGTTNSATKWTKEAVENAKTNLTKAKGGVGGNVYKVNSATGTVAEATEQILQTNQENAYKTVYASKNTNGTITKECSDGKVRTFTKQENGKYTAQQ